MSVPIWRPAPQRPSISMRFCTAAPEAPFPRLSNLASNAQQKSDILLTNPPAAVTAFQN
jgi:hypothetical protein